jgi:hypothetical protein
MGAGGMQRDYLNSLFGQDIADWTANQNHPFTSMNWLAGMLGNSKGGMGPNETVYGQAGSQYAPWLGAALAGASFLG